MEKFNWNYPTTMWIGEKRIKDLYLACENLGIKKPLLVTDNALSKTKIVTETLETIKKQNILVEIFSNVVGNPTGKKDRKSVV